MRGDLRGGGEERGHRRRRALVDVGRPHVERHRRDLEAETGEQENQAEYQSDAALRRRLGDPGKRHVAGEAVDQRAAVQQHAGRQRAEHEIFEAGFGRPHGIAVRWPRRRRARDSSARARDRARSGRRPRSASCRRVESRIRTEYSNSAAARAGEIVERHDDGEGRAGIGQDLHEAGKVIDDEAAAEIRAVGNDQRRSRRHDQQQDRADDCGLRRSVADRRRPSAAPWRRPPARSPAGPGIIAGAARRSSARPHFTSAADFAAPSACW